MITGKKFIRKLEGYASHIPNGCEFRVGIKIQTEDLPNLQRVGFNTDLVVGETLLPTIVGRFTRLNSLGSEKRIPGEKVYKTFTRWGKRSQFAGRDQREEVWDIFEFTRKCFPTERILPPSMELIICEKESQKYVIVDSVFTKGHNEDKDAIHAVNMMLEIFQRAELLSTELQALIRPSYLYRVHWEIIEPGRYPWARNSLIERQQLSNRPVVEERLNTIEHYEPEYIVLGSKGFAGYLVFGFPRLGFCVFECAQYGNATYVIRGEWEAVSKLTKAEIIQNSIHEYRFIHRADWKTNIANLLSSNVVESA